MGFVQVTLLIYLEKNILSRILFDGETNAHYENAELAIWIVIFKLLAFKHVTDSDIHLRGRHKEWKVN